MTPLSSRAEDNLEGMTKAQLLAHAEAHGITGVSPNMTKAAIREAIDHAAG